MILNRSRKAIDQVDVVRMTVCPKHRFQLTTLYKAKLIDGDFLMDDRCTSLIWHYNIPQDTHLFRKAL